MSAQRFGTYRNSLIVRDALRFAPGRPNLAAGLRAGLATTAPLLLSALTSRPELAFAGLAGFGTIMADKGGSYATRARAMAAIALLGAVVTGLGTVLGASAPVATLLTLLVVSLGGFVRLFGAEATSIGTLTSVSLVVACARPAHDLAGALYSVQFFLLGSAWAALISLVVWPLRVYRPSRLAVAAALRELARVARSFHAAGGSLAAQALRRVQLGHAREQLEAARAALGSSRRGRPGPSRRGEQLVALLESADQLFAALVALEDALAFEPDRLTDLASTALSLEELDQVEELSALVAHELERCADALLAERPPAGTDAGLLLRAALEPRATAVLDPMPQIMLRALERLQRTVELTRAIDDPSAPQRASRAEPRQLSSRASWRSLLGDHLGPQSAIFRHALRMGMAVAAVSLAVHAFGLSQGYWATLTCLVIMQPHGAATWSKALQRVLGTVIGAALAVLVASFVTSAASLVLFVFCFVAIAMALLPLNYGAFAVFLTPGFVLLAETHAGHHGLAWLRVTNTLIGAAVALVASRLLFPLAERDQFRPLLAEALRRARLLLDVAATARPSGEDLREARRGIGLALLNAEASYQRLLTESGIQPEESEALLSLLLFTHRLGSGLIALAVAEGTAAHAELIERAPALRRALDLLHEAALQKQLPGEPESAPPPVLNHEPAAERVDTLFEQLSVLRHAIQRWNLSRGAQGPVAAAQGGR